MLSSYLDLCPSGVVRPGRADHSPGEAFQSIALIGRSGAEWGLSGSRQPVGSVRGESPALYCPTGLGGFSFKTWRREWDSNPRYSRPYSGFQVRFQLSLGVPRSLSAKCQQFFIVGPDTGTRRLTRPHCRPVWPLDTVPSWATTTGSSGATRWSSSRGATKATREPLTAPYSRGPWTTPTSLRLGIIGGASILVDGPQP